MEAVEVVKKLRAAGIAAAPRAGWVRTSPHFYISPSDIDRMLAELP
jgi:selenocysteine lyase/cysteine desulfurase